MATALVTQIAYAVQTLFDPAGTAGRLVDLGKLANYGLLTSFTPAYLFTTGVNGAWYDPSDINLTWRRNLLTYSEQFDNAVWTKINATVTANAVTAPDGTLTADKLVENTATGAHNIQNATSAPGVNGVESLYLKAGERTKVLMFDAVASKGVGFDLSAGATFTVSGISLASAYSITSAGNGWYRCTLSGTSASDIRTYICDASGNFSYTGDGTSGIYIWGAQLEQGSTATPYQRITDGIQDYLQYQAQPVLYRDAVGTQPVTAVEQPVGLMLDKSKGLVLGPELVTNGDFSNGTAGWTNNGSTISVVNGELEITSSGSAPSARQVLNTIAGKTYKFSYSLRRGTTPNSNLVRIGTTAGGTDIYSSGYSVSGAYVFYFTALSATTYIAIGYGETATGQTSYWDNISVRELPGNHAFNPSGNSANFPVLSARYNLLTKTEYFSDAVWSKTVGTTAEYGFLAPDGTNTAWKITLPTAVSSQLYQSVAAVSASITQKMWMRADTPLTVAYGFYDSTGDVSNLSLTTAWTEFARIRPAGLTNADRRSQWIYGDSNNVVLYVWHPDLRVANDALNQPAYQRVNTTTDYDTVGFKPYLSFNGVNQWLQTNSIDFSYTDKMFVSVGVRKLSDAARSVIVELSASTANPGVFNIEATGLSGGTLRSYLFASGGSSVVAAYQDLPNNAAPVTNGLSGVGNISGDKAILRVNESQVAQSTATQGTGNYGNYPLYIGARAGSSLWFNGRLYGLVVAGKAASASEIASTEAYLNQKTGAY